MRHSSKLGLESLLMVVLLAWAIASSMFAAHYYVQLETAKRDLEALKSSLASIDEELLFFKERSVVVDIALDYGNGTIRWFNDTVLPRGSTVLHALIAVAMRVEYRYGEWGAYVTSVDGVAEKLVSKSEGYSWMWYVYDRAKGKWVLGPVAADKYELKQGDIVKWVYSHWKF